MIKAYVVFVDKNNILSSKTMVLFGKLYKENNMISNQNK